MVPIEITCVGIIIFIIGVIGIVLGKRKQLLQILISIELILLAVNILLIVYSVILDDLIGQLIALIILGVAGAESAIGLAIIISYYRVKGNLNLW